MEILVHLLSELTMIVIGLLVIILLVGVKRACPHCGEKVVYRTYSNKCQACDGDLGVDLASPAADNRYQCPCCGTEFYYQLEACPKCQATFDEEFYASDDKSEEK